MVHSDSLRILLIEDNRDLSDLLVLAVRLEERSDRLSIARTGAEGISAFLSAAASSDPYDLIVLDRDLAGPMDGLRVARFIRGHEERLKLEPLQIFGWTTHGDKERSLSAGMDSHLTKPLGLIAIRQFIRYARRFRTLQRATV